MNYMFSGCKNIINLNVSSFDTKKVTNTSYMFSCCEKLTNLDLSSFDMENIKNINYMFRSSNNLEEIKIQKGMKNKININGNVKIIEI